MICVTFSMIYFYGTDVLKVLQLRGTIDADKCSVEEDYKERDLRREDGN